MGCASRANPDLKPRCHQSMLSTLRIRIRIKFDIEFAVVWGPFWGGFRHLLGSHLGHASRYLRSKLGLKLSSQLAVFGKLIAHAMFLFQYCAFSPKLPAEYGSRSHHVGSEIVSARVLGWFGCWFSDGCKRERGKGTGKVKGEMERAKGNGTGTCKGKWKGCYIRAPQEINPDTSQGCKGKEKRAKER